MDMEPGQEVVDPAVHRRDVRLAADIDIAPDTDRPWAVDGRLHAAADNCRVVEARNSLAEDPHFDRTCSVELVHWVAADIH